MADRSRVVLVDTWEEGVGEGIAIRTTTLIIGCGELESDTGNCVRVGSIVVSG